MPKKYDTKKLEEKDNKTVLKESDNTKKTRAKTNNATKTPKTTNATKTPKTAKTTASSKNKEVKTDSKKTSPEKVKSVSKGKTPSKTVSKNNSSKKKTSGEEVKKKKKEVQVDKEQSVPDKTTSKKRNASSSNENSKKTGTQKKETKSKVVTKKNEVSKSKVKNKEQDNKLLKKEDKNFKAKKVKKAIWVGVLIIFVILFIVSGMKIYEWQSDNKKIDGLVNELEEIVEIQEVEIDEKKEKLVNPPAKTATSDYWSYIKLPLIQVDFTKLKEKNEDTVAFLKVNGTNINYPVVQRGDNDYYLNHAYDKSKNSSGWVFMDYRNNVNNLDDNTIIYAHGRVNNTMFGSLKNIMKSNWYTDTDNYVIYLSTENKNMLWQVFSVYMIPSETYYLTSQFGTKDSKQKFIETILERSEYDFKADVNISDKFLTLSTCMNHTNRVVLHAKLIKVQDVE